VYVYVRRNKVVKGRRRRVEGGGKNGLENKEEI
jgi:hypothetical protein